jgi:hypothetical protein
MPVEDRLLVDGGRVVEERSERKQGENIVKKPVKSKSLTQLSLYRIGCRYGNQGTVKGTPRYPT